jgi:hypothetical protein
MLTGNGSVGNADAHILRCELDKAIFSVKNGRP